MFTVTQVGSWPRSKPLLRALRERQKGRITREEFERVADPEVERCVRFQEKAGVDIVVDGELRRDNFYSFITEKVEGTRLMSLAEMLETVEDKASFEEMLGTLDVPASAIRNPTCVGRLARREPLAGVVRSDHLHDLGKLMMAFVMLWAYFALSQFLVIWSGNLPEEIPWYLRRLGGEWRWVSLALALLHFALPFVLLLSADLKRRAGQLATIAGLVLVMRVVDTVWLIVPEFSGTGPAGAGVITDLLAVVGIGGLWMWRFLSTLRTRPLLPRNDPNWARVQAAVESEG